MRLSQPYVGHFRVQTGGDVRLADQNMFIRELYQQCLGILDTKGVDYTPDNIALAEAVETAWEEGTTPEKILWTMMRKHYSAIRRFIQAGRVESEPIRGRFTDVVNYFALIAFYAEKKERILCAIHAHQLLNTVCEQNDCLADQRNWNLIVEICDRCDYVRWLHDQLTVFGSPALWSPLTLRVPDSFPGGRGSTSTSSSDTAKPSER